MRLLQGKRVLYYNRTNLLTIPQLACKLRDNAKILFMVSILTTLVLVGVGLYYRAFGQLEQTVLEFAPVGLMVVRAKPGTSQEVDNVLQEYGVEIEERAEFSGLAAYTLASVDLQGRTRGPSYSHSSVFVVPVSQVNSWVTGVSIELQEGHAVFMVPENIRIPYEVMSRASIEFGEPRGNKDKVAELILDGRIHVRVPNEQGLVRQLMVVDDEVFRQLSVKHKDEYGLGILGYMLADWRKSSNALEHL